MHPPVENFELSESQLAALRLLTEGHTQKGAARLLGVGEEAIKDRMRYVRAKLQARTNEQAAAIAARKGLI